MKIALGVSHGDNFTGEMFGTAMKIAYEVGKKGHEFFCITSGSCLVDRNRNDIFKQAQKLQCDWLLFIDTDSNFSGDFDVLDYMISLNENIVSGIYHIKEFPFRPAVFNFDHQGRLLQMNYIPQQREYWDVTGAGFFLISKMVMDAFTPEIMEKWGEPFDFIFDGFKKKYHEDVAFCWRSKQLGFKICVDPSIDIIHMKKQPISRQMFLGSIEYMKSVDKVENGIDGWMTENELKFLAEKARGMESIVELGSHKGRSSDVLLKNCNGKVYCVDLWDGKTEFGLLAERQQVFVGDEVYNKFMENVGHYPNLVPIKMDSSKAVEQFNGDRFDMVFIDAGHDYDSVKKDIEAWLPKCNKLICGHDYSPAWPGVVQAVHEKFKQINFTETIWWVEL